MTKTLLTNFKRQLIIIFAILLLLVPLSPAVRADSLLDVLTPFYDPNASSGGGCSMSGSIALLMEAIAMHESHGNPTAQNDPNNLASASGKYQIIQPTWQGLAKQYYPPAYQYAVAKDAPEAVQDAVVYLAFADKVSKNYNAFQIAMGWYGGFTIVNDIAANFNVVPGGNSQSYGNFGNEMVEFIQAGAATDAIAKANGDSPRYNGSTPLSKIPIIAQQAPDFTTDLAKYGNLPPLKVVTYNSDGTPSGNGSTVGGTPTCSGTPAGNFVFYNQGDSRWANHQIYTGSICGGLPDTIACAGCGPTSVAMVVATLSDSSVTPDKVGDYMTQNNGYSSAGATVAGMEAALGHWGLNVHGITSPDQAVTIIKNGGLIIAGGQGQSPFTTAGHVVVLRAINSDGDFLVGNPAPTTQLSQDEPFSYQDLQAAGLIYMIGVTK